MESGGCLQVVKSQMVFFQSGSQMDPDSPRNSDWMRRSLPGFFTLLSPKFGLGHGLFNLRTVVERERKLRVAS